MNIKEKYLDSVSFAIGKETARVKKQERNIGALIALASEVGLYEEIQKLF